MNSEGEIPRVKVRLAESASVVNAMLNAPEVRPWVADASEGVLDVSKQMEDPNTFFLVGDYGGVMLTRLMQGIWEVHTFCTKAGRGTWMLGFIQSAQQWLFTKTDCFEVLTRIPHTHKPALSLAMKSGMTYDFTRPDGIKLNGAVIPVDVYRLTIQDWIRIAPGLEERGERFHEWLNEEAGKAGFVHPHDPDSQHDRVVGAIIEMFLGGQPVKAALSYNRWAIISRHALIALTSLNPPAIRMDVGTLQLLPDGNLEFVPCRTLN